MSNLGHPEKTKKAVRKMEPYKRDQEIYHRRQRYCTMLTDRKWTEIKMCRSENNKTLEMEQASQSCVRSVSLMNSGPNLMEERS